MEWNGMTEYEWKKYLRVLERDSKDPALSRLGLSPNAYNALLLERLRGAGRRQTNRAITK